MKSMNQKLLLTIALAVALAACGKKDEAAPTVAPASTAPAATPAAAPASTPTPPPAETTPATPVASTTPIAAGALPEACEAYLKRAAACYEKAAATNAAAVEQMKQGLEQVRTQWNAVPDKSQLGSACTMANDQFTQTVSMLKCE